MLLTCKAGDISVDAAFSMTVSAAISMEMYLVKYRATVVQMTTLCCVVEGVWNTVTLLTDTLN